MNHSGVKIKVFIILALVCAGFFCAQSIFADNLININTADLEELDTLPGIGPVKAQAIIEYRELNGSFQTIEEIMNVSGVGQATFENIKDLITIVEVEEEGLGGGEGEEGTGGSEESEISSQPPSYRGDDGYHFGDIVINEFVSDPADGEVEWIELYNTVNKTIDLTGWTIEEGSGAKTKLEGEIDKFFVVENPEGYLNNKGDIIVLRSANGGLIDQVVYGEWGGANTKNNAPAASDPNSIARKIDGQDGASDADDFALTTSPTKGESNIITEGPEGEEGRGGKVGDRGIVISEILPNPFGIDADGEFIELYNAGEKQIDLFGWRLKSSSAAEFEFKKEKIIAAKEYLAIYRSESGLVLNNKGGSVKLFKPGNVNASQVVEFKEAEEGWSYNLADPEGLRARRPSGSAYAWSDKPTPGRENILPEVNNPPIAVFYCPDEILAGVPVVFDASDTIDEDGDELTFSWDFGDGFKNNLQNPEHTFMKEGVFTVRLVVSDGKDEVSLSKKLEVRSEKSLINAGESPKNSTERDQETLSKVVINEFLPDPEGSDAEGEWVEILNKSDDKVNLLNWTLDDVEGGSRPYKFAGDIWIEAGDYYIVDRADSKIALNNSGDIVRLFNGLDELIDEVEYDAATEGESYARGEDGEWFWTNVLTPGKENIISLTGGNYGNKYDNLKADEVRLQAEEAGLRSSSDIILTPFITTIEGAKSLSIGDLVLVNGIVAVLPDVLGSQYFYITEEGAGVQVYSHKKDFPELRVGDYIEVTGKLSKANGELRIKIKEKNNIIVLEHKEEPMPIEISCAEIEGELAGSLVKIAGEIVERKGSIIYLDDGSGEVKVYLKSTAGLNPKNYEEGEIIEVTGIVGLTSSGPRVTPRSARDIIKKGVLGEKSEEVVVLGAELESDKWALEERDKKIELFKYLLVIAGAAVVVLSGLLAKAVISGRN
jgi:competence ComEA-like helix-hairpin-helix protein